MIGILYRTLNCANSYPCDAIINTAIRAKLAAKSSLSMRVEAERPIVTLTGKAVNYNAVEQINSVVTAYETARAVSRLRR